MAFDEMRPEPKFNHPHNFLGWTRSIPLGSAFDKIKETMSARAARRISQPTIDSEYMFFSSLKFGTHLSNSWPSASMLRYRFVRSMNIPGRVLRIARLKRIGKRFFNQSYPDYILSSTDPQSTSRRKRDGGITPVEIIHGG